MSILSESPFYFLFTLPFEFQDKGKHELCFIYFKESFLHLRHGSTFPTLYFDTIIESVFLSGQFNTLKLNVIDDMTNLEQEHRLVVAFELKVGTEKLEI